MREGIMIKLWNCVRTFSCNDYLFV